MNATKFRIPGTDLYLRSDGKISPEGDPTEKAIDLTSKNARLLDVVYHGRALKQVVFLEDKKIEDPIGITIDEAKDIIDWMGIGVAVLEFTEKLNKWIVGANDAPDPIMESLRRIHDTLSQIQDFALGAWVSSREDNLAFLLAHSSTAIQTANAFLQSKASRNDPVWAAKIAIAERDSLLAVNTFSDTQRGYWLRPESIAAISWAGNPTDYYQGWMPHIPDRAEVSQFRQVWDYRWAQPALVYTFVARLVVLKAFGTGSAAEVHLRCQEIKGYVKLLGSVFSKRWSGIRTLKRLSDLQHNDYLNRGRFPMVAVDIYGGDYIGGIFFASNIKPSFGGGKLAPPGIAAPNMDSYLKPTRPVDLVWVDKNVSAFADWWWSVLYLRTGLEDLLLIISQLEAVCDQPWFARAYIDVRTKISFAKRDEEARKDALVAVALSAVIPTGDEEKNAARTHFLYEALRTRGEHAQAIVEKCVRDLTHLTETSVQ
jgi:hypothetical protein